MGGQVFAPPRLPPGFWSRADVAAALADRDFGALFRLVAKYSGASQTKIAIAVGMTQGQVSTIMTGNRRVTAIDVAERALDGLDAPDRARVAVGLAPRTVPDDHNGDWLEPLRSETADTGSGVWQPATEEDVDRRDVLRLGGIAVAGGLIGSQRAAERVASIARALTPYGGFTSVPLAPRQPPSVSSLTRSVASLKRDYQACHYTALLDCLPSLLEDVQLGVVAAAGDELVEVHRLAADVYQVAGSLMLKLGDLGLAAFAADRSMEAATRSQDSVAVAASARLVTHSLMQGGHPGRATEIAVRAAERMAADMCEPTAAEISVYGALLLRGAVAAATGESRADALRLVDEAGEAAGRLGRDDNAYWTAFGPTNVAQHRVYIATVLGDAGTAVDLARRIDVRKIPIAERKATLFIDCAAALVQWGKYEQAYHALRTAEEIAPEELRTRAAVRRLVGDLAVRSPRTLRQQAREFAEHLGVEL